MKMMWFHLMPYTELPEDFKEKHPSVWVDIHSSLFDPKRAHLMYNDFMDELEFAAETTNILVVDIRDCFLLFIINSLAFAFFRFCFSYSTPNLDFCPRCNCDSTRGINSSYCDYRCHGARPR